MPDTEILGKIPEGNGVVGSAGGLSGWDSSPETQRQRAQRELRTQRQEKVHRDKEMARPRDTQRYRKSGSLGSG